VSFYQLGDDLAVATRGKIGRLFPMTKKLNLDFHGRKFPVPKGNLIDLFEHHTELVAKASYEVQSSVPVEIFEIFVKALETGAKVSITKENADAIAVLAKEFWLEDLLSECSVFQTTCAPELITALSERIYNLEHQLSSPPVRILAELKESIANHERQLESLDCRISALETNLRTDLKELKSDVRRRDRLSTFDSESKSGLPAPVRPVSPAKSLREVEFPLRAAKSVEGIIAYLTHKHGGNVHDKGIVTLTSKSVLNNDSDVALRNAADLTSDSYFNSGIEPGQWICWDFHEMRVRWTHYTIRGTGLAMKSWVVESSLDGVNWIEIDRQTGNRDLVAHPGRASFAVSKSAEGRFIRLTQTGPRHAGDNNIGVRAVEFFGTLLE
jgi:hypothetical protein